MVYVFFFSVVIVFYLLLFLFTGFTVCRPSIVKSAQKNIRTHTHILHTLVKIVVNTLFVCHIVVIILVIVVLLEVALTTLKQNKLLMYRVMFVDIFVILVLVFLLFFFCSSSYRCVIFFTVRAAFGIYNFEFRNKKIGFNIPDELLLQYLAQRHDLTNFVIEIGQGKSQKKTNPTKRYVFGIIIKLLSIFN